jgi:pilus assembly protein CpaF
MCLGAGLAARVGPAVALIDRVAHRLVLSSVPFERSELARAARGLLLEESPLAKGDMVETIVDSLVGLGPIEPLLRDPEVTDVLVNGPGEIWIEKRGELSRTDVRYVDDLAITAAVERVIAPLGLRLDLSSPVVDARLPDGSRLHAVIPPASVDHPVVAVRRFTPAVRRLVDLVEAGAATIGQCDFLVSAVRERRSLIVSGGTGSGKTTLLNLLAGEIPRGERVVTIEDAAELDFPGHVVRLEARPPNAEGAGQVTVRALLRSALRLRPDRIVVGEVRGPEALDLISALNTGHAGSMSTVHANSPDEALLRLETLALMGEERVGTSAVRRQLHAAVQIVVHVERREGKRRIALIGRVGPSGCEPL